MSGWKALALPSVRREYLQVALRDHSVDWDAAHHVTATTSVASALRRPLPAGTNGSPTGDLGTHALPVATVMDLLTLPGWPGEWRLSLDGFPTPATFASDPSDYRQAVQRWQRQASGRRMRMGIAFDDCLRRVARSGAYPGQVGQVLVAARRDYRRSVHALIAAGVGPADVEATDDLTKLAVHAWETAESEVPALAGARRDLWLARDTQAGDPSHTSEVLGRLRAALHQAFGPATGRRQLVHHGFYFYTPPQWALFQLLRYLPEVDQLFVVHDDATNPCFESWRRFFTPALGMPEPELLTPTVETPTPMAAALREALQGGTVDRSRLDGHLSVVECGSPAELVRELWTQRQEAEQVRVADAPSLRVFAPDADTVTRYVERLGLATPDGRVDLAHLPVGRFLLALHDCISYQHNGGTRVAIEPDMMLDLAASGYLPVPDTESAPADRALRRARQYFEDCRSPHSWLQRAEQLLLLVEAEVAPLGARLPGQTDIERLAAAAANPLRVVPWADLSVREATGLRDTVAAAVQVIGQVARLERVRLSDHVQFIRERLELGMRDLPDDLRAQVVAQVDGFGVGLDAEVEADGLIDVVSLLLGREVAPETALDPDPHGGELDHLRGVDALGHLRHQQAIHVTNLADTAFPGQVAAVGWPFTLEQLRARANAAMLEVLDTRVAAAALSDLYLFWLALDGVEPGRSVTLSWISEVAGDLRNPSALVTLLTDPVVLPQPVRDRTGGVRVQPGTAQADQVARYAVPAATNDPSDGDALEAVAQSIDPAAAASAVLCTRRFAIQWALGPSAAFQADHHHAMLYGNVYAALVRDQRMSIARARELCDDLWAFLTSGQRTSSKWNSRIKATGRRSSNPWWRLTLKGWKEGTEPFDRAYQRAIHRTPATPALLAADISQFLPPGVDDQETCGWCPVRDRCRDFRDRTD